MNSYIETADRIQGLLSYIADCELPDEYSAAAELNSPVLRRSRRSLAVDEKIQSAAVVANNIVSFVAGMSKQNKEDIKNSILLATLVANKACPELSGKSWYKKYMEVLSNACAWVPGGWKYVDFTATEQRFTMDEVGMSILSKAVAVVAAPGAGAMLLLGVAQQAIEALQANQKPLKLFERKSRTHKGGAFNIASCVESEDGEVAMAIGYVDFSSVVSVTNVLFWEWNSDSVSIHQVAAPLVFNQSVYAHVRDSIMRKLGANAISAVEGYEI